MTAPLDRSGAIREGEQLDAAKLEAYLREQIAGLEGAFHIEQFRSGHSNLTYLVRFGVREFVLRRPPFGSKVKSAHDMGREYTVLSHLHGVYPPAPRPVLYCDDVSILGAPFYLMNRLHGVILRGTAPEGLEFQPDTVRGLCQAFIENLADLHAVEYDAAGLAELRKPGRYCERQVHGWSNRYAGSRTDDIPDIEKVIGWLTERIPPDSGSALIHNDYKFDNVMLDAADLTRIIGVLDWEMSTIGDPLSDLGCALGYWAEPGDSDALQLVQCFVTTLPGALTRRELAEHYAARTGRDISNLLFYYVFALFKIAVIVQQIYYRYAQGLTRDDRFAIMIEMVRVLGAQAVRAIETGKV